MVSTQMVHSGIVGNRPGVQRRLPEGRSTSRTASDPGHMRGVRRAATRPHRPPVLLVGLPPVRLPPAHPGGRAMITC
jgi:hypothetical protein